jgi:hypothetical protein
MSIKARIKKLASILRPKPKVVFTLNRDDVNDEDTNTIYVWLNLEG